jgi:catechol 2,3-dioxygenase-like lactoylglutathione lyase family enzyme
MRLHHAALVAGSEEKADQFFLGILNLKKVKTSLLQRDLVCKIFESDVECRLILYGGEDFAIEVFVPDPPPKEKTPFTHLCLEVEDREKFLGDCQSAGLPVKRVPRGDSVICFIQDFDGNLFEIKESAG